MLTSNFTGKTKVFKNDKGFYSTSISKKTVDGSYENAYINLAFKKGTDIPNGADIEVKKGFLTFDIYTKNDKKSTFLKIFVSEYEILGDKTAVNDDDDIPF